MNNRPDILGKVTGKAVYVNDISLPGMVYAKMVRSPISSGRIISVDTSGAEKMPGVLRIFTGQNNRSMMQLIGIDKESGHVSPPFIVLFIIP